ncbi:MAG: Na/Pi cotransporter family protein [Verrucomicrobiaceae bacterium]|nr:Na/Pi cotransporter family protein [Verrucomicrobiaceae bacterium]
MTELLLQVFGGLAIFIFGMKLMSDGLHHVAGERMRTILRLFSANRFVGVVSGATVTAVIQSSSASTVMVIGFVNAGLLSLVQAISIIFGANIGTTITAQLVAFDISWIIMPSIILGLVLSFIPKRTISNWSATIIGLGFLFLGMEMMSNELKTLAEDPAFKQAFQTFKCAPVNGVIPPIELFGAIAIGMIATFVIQSSSACSGIVVALGASGLVDIYTAVALVLGSNIGTTITAQLAAIPANRIAKQTALAHTLFNLMGVLIIVCTFWFTIDGEPIFFKAVEWFSKGGDLPRQIANAHTLFNVCTTIVLIAFVPTFAKICEKVIPIGNERVRYQRLEPSLLSTPPIALAQAASALRKMLKKSWKMADCTLNIYNKNDEKNQEFLKSLDTSENDVDTRQKDITQYLAKLMQCDLTSEEADQIPMLLHCTNDAERIGDLAEGIRDIMNRIKKNKYTFSPNAETEYNDLHQKLESLAQCAIVLLETKSQEASKNALKIRASIVETLNNVEAEHVSRVNSGTCRPEIGILYLELLESIRKVAKNLFNIIDRAGKFYDKIPRVRRNVENTNNQQA